MKLELVMNYNYIYELKLFIELMVPECEEKQPTTQHG